MCKSVMYSDVGECHSTSQLGRLKSGHLSALWLQVHTGR